MFNTTFKVREKKLEGSVVHEVILKIRGFNAAVLHCKR